MTKTPYLKCIGFDFGLCWPVADVVGYIYLLPSSFFLFALGPEGDHTSPWNCVTVFSLCANLQHICTCGPREPQLPELQDCALTLSNLPLS